jgi:hypothetical protein
MKQGQDAADMAERWNFHSSFGRKICISEVQESGSKDLAKARPCVDTYRHTD